MRYTIEIIAAPSTLGLSSSGVEKLAEIFLNCGLQQKIYSNHPVIYIPAHHYQRSTMRDSETNCLNTSAIIDFSKRLHKAVIPVIQRKHFCFVLGGDCSILLGITAALKTKGVYGLVFIDAHADFYSPDKSTTGEVADMDLAIVTGRGPELLTNMDGLKPYILDKNVIHIAQRDQEQAEEYGSPDIRTTDIACFSLKQIRAEGLGAMMEKILRHIHTLDIDGFWIHFDTDVLADEINPAVDYKLPGGLQFNEATMLLSNLLATGKAAGISVTIYNGDLDANASIARQITDCLGKAFSPNEQRN